MTNSELSRLADELAIQNLQARYSDAVNRRDADAMESTWAPDSVWGFMGNPINGRDAIISFWKEAMAGFPKILQFYYPAGIHIDGDGATCRWYLRELVIDSKGKPLQFYGVYNDKCSKIDNQWLFSERRFDLIYQGAGPLSADGWIGYPQDVNMPL